MSRNQKPPSKNQKGFRKIFHKFTSKSQHQGDIVDSASIDVKAVPDEPSALGRGLSPSSQTKTGKGGDSGQPTQQNELLKTDSSDPSRSPPPYDEVDFGVEFADPDPGTGETNFPSTDPFGDRQRTEKRYIQAAKRLEAALKRRLNSEPFEIPVFTSALATDSLTQFRREIKQILDARQAMIEDQGIWSKGKRTVEKTFTAISPLLKSLLSMAQNGSSVFDPSGMLCGGLIFLITLADSHIARKAEVEQILDYISHQLGQLEVIKRLPDAGVESQGLINRATDVFSAALLYLAVHIHRVSNRIGVVESIARSVISGDDECESVKVSLKTAVDAFNATLSNFGHSVAFKTFEAVEEIRQNISAMKLKGSLDPEPSKASQQKFIVPYPRNPNFVGRVELLELIHASLSDEFEREGNHRVALHGFGGVGKTQLALEYVYSQWEKESYQRIYWISAVSETTLFSGFHELAKKTCCISDPNVKPADAVERVIFWLNDQEGVLLILDNLQDVDVVQPYLLTPSNSRHTLFTTRISQVDQIPAIGIHVDVLDVDDATNLLIRRSNSWTVAKSTSGMEECVAICTELGFLALAIEQAAAFIREALKNIFKFLPCYRKSRKECLARKSKGNHYYVESVATTWRLSFEQVSQSNEDSPKLLNLLAFLNPDGILMDFLDSGKEGLIEDTREILLDDFRFYEALSELERFSLIRRETDSGDERITIHRLVQSVIKDDMSEDSLTNTTMSVIGLCSRAFPLWHEWKREQLLLSRRYEGQVVFPILTIQTVKSDEMGLLLQRVGVFLREEGNYQQAKLLLENAVEILEVTRGKEHPDSIIATSDLAWTYNQLGELKIAADLRERVLETSRRVFGEEHPETLKMMANLVVTYWNQGRLKDTVKLQEEMLELRIKLLGKENPETFSAMSGLAVLYSNQGLWKEATGLGEEACELSKKVLGEEHPDTLRVMVGLALAYSDQGRWNDCTKLLEKVFENRKKCLGNEHPDTLHVMVMLAETYERIGRLDDAVSLGNTALEASMRILGAEHRESLKTMASLGKIYSTQRQYDDAVRLGKNALELSLKVLGNDNPDTVRAMTKLGRTYREQGNLDVAIEMLETSVSLSKQVFGSEHLETLRTTAELALAYQKKGRLTEAIGLMDTVGETMKGVLGDQHPDVLWVMSCLAKAREESATCH